MTTAKMKVGTSWQAQTVIGYDAANRITSLVRTDLTPSFYVAVHSTRLALRDFAELVTFSAWMPKSWNRMFATASLKLVI
jgi:hypothetical protein